MCERYSNFKEKLIVGRKICNSCRLKLETKRKPPSEEMDICVPSKKSQPNDPQDCSENIFNETTQDQLSYTSSENSSDFEEDDSDDEMDFNRALHEINLAKSHFQIPPVTEKSDLIDTYQKLTRAFKERMNIISKENLVFSPNVCAKCEYIMDSARQKFSTGDRRQKYTILTTILEGLTKKKVRELFNCGKYITSKAFQLKDNEGPFSFPDVSHHGTHFIGQEVKQKVVAFYNNPNYTRVIPGTRNSIKKNQEGKYEPVAKRWILLALHELYEEFIKENEKISLSSFYLLEPKECVWTGNKIFQQACCCVIHENFSLLLPCFENVDLNWILNNIPCDSESEVCMLGVCSLCPKNIDKLFTSLKESSEITFYQWKQTDRVELKITFPNY